MLINLIGYRRLGHNELDEPAYTQPVMSRTIKAHPPVSKLYAQKLVDEGVHHPGAGGRDDRAPPSGACARRTRPS